MVAAEVVDFVGLSRNFSPVLPDHFKFNADWLSPGKRLIDLCVAQGLPATVGC